MSERPSESDFRNVAHDMPAETNAAVSQGHLLHWAFEHHLVHFDAEGRMSIDGEKDPETETADSEDLRSFAEKLYRLEAGDQDLNIPPTAPAA